MANSSIADAIRAKSIPRISSLSLSAWTFPLALLAVCVLSFGLLIPWLGFYQDDWHAVFYARRHGLSSLWELYFYDNRPLSAWPYLLAFPLLGFNPLNWHLFLLALRWLTATTFWLVSRTLWPGETRLVAWGALLFTVYPLFKLQPLAVAYTQHWSSFLLYAFSILAMLQAHRRPRWFWSLTAAALITTLAHLVTVEYFSGLELLRPALLYLQAASDSATTRRRLAVTLRRWFPYLLVFLAFILWRVFWMPTPGYDNNAPVLLYALLSNPLSASIELVQVILQDFVSILASSWYRVFEPQLFDFQGPADLFRLFLVLAGGAALFIYMHVARLSNAATQAPVRQDRWQREALGLGLAATLLGPVPAWITGQSITGSNPLWSDRLGLAAMFGASLVILALLEALVRGRQRRDLILCALVGLSIGWHFRSTNEFRWAWEHQTSFYRQLTWRAPSIQPGTALLSNDELFLFMGDYPTSFAINSLYPQSGEPGTINYWFYPLNPNLKDRIEELRAGTGLSASKFSSRFRGRSQDSLLLLYRTDQDQCLWVLRPEDQELRGLPELAKDLLPISDPGRIQPAPPDGAEPFVEVLGQDPALDWCYYYQKADLARQFEDWPAAVQLWEQAARLGLQPKNGFEYLPFIEAYAHLGQWERALELSAEADRRTTIAYPALCAAWERFDSNPEPEAERARREAGELLGCQSP